MEVTQDDADAQAVLEKLKDQMVTELRAVLAEHHKRSQEEFNRLLMRCGGMLEDFVRSSPRQELESERRLSSAGSARCSLVSSVPLAKGDPPTPFMSEEATRSHQRRGSAESAFSAVSTFSDHLGKKRRSHLSDGYKKSRHSLDLGEVSVSMPPPGRYSREKAREFLESASCHGFFSSVILMYVISMGLEVEASGDTGRVLATILQVVCNVLFTFELFLRLYALGREFCSGEGLLWNVLDFAFVVVFSLEIVVIIVSDDLVDDTFHNVALLRMVRLVRVIRIMRVIRVVRFFQPLRVLVHSIIATLNSLSCAVLLLLVIIYTFGVVFTQAAKDAQADHMPSAPGLGQYFGSLYRSVLTLFQAVTGGVDWEHVYQPLHDVHWSYGGLFVIYFTFATFAVMNVMTGLFCHSAIESAKGDHEEVIYEHLANKSTYVKNLRELFASLAGGTDEGFTLRAFEQNMNNERVEAYFNSLDIRINDAWKLFRLLVDDSCTVIDMDTFIEGCLNLKGPATTIDVKDLAHHFNWFAKHIDKRLTQLSEGQLAVRGEELAVRGEGNLHPAAEGDAARMMHL